MITEMDFEADDPCPTIKWDEDFSESQLKEALEATISFATSEGVEVIFGYNLESTWSWKNNAIFINSRLGVERMYYTMLHELGHYLVYRDLRDEENPTPYMLHYPGFVGRHSRFYAKNKGLSSKRFWFSRIHEEMDAWRKGMDVATMLDIPLSLYAYIDRASRGVDTYMEAALENTRKELDSLKKT